MQGEKGSRRAVQRQARLPPRAPAKSAQHGPFRTGRCGHIARTTAEDVVQETVLLWNRVAKPEGGFRQPACGSLKPRGRATAAASLPRSGFVQLQKHAFTPDYPEDWFEEITEAILSLAEMPFRCALAPESEEFEEEIRHLIVGSYRVLFTIEEDRVHVLHVRHGKQDILRSDS